MCQTMDVEAGFGLLSFSSAVTEITVVVSAAICVIIIMAVTALFGSFCFSAAVATITTTDAANL